MKKRRACSDTWAGLRSESSQHVAQIAAIDFRRPTIAAWEAADAEPLAIRLQRIVEFYGVEIGVLTGRAPLPRQRPLPRKTPPSEAT